MQISGEHKEDRMRKETEIDLAVAEAVGSKYDNACKRLFQNREIIAPVLKEVVPEYKNSTVEEIIRYIDADSIEDIPVDDGFLTLVNRIIWQKPHNCGFFYVKFIKF